MRKCENMENKLETILETIRHARDVIGLLDRDPGCYDWDDFKTPELRDMYYQLNSMACKLYDMQENFSKSA